MYKRREIVYSINSSLSLNQIRKYITKDSKTRTENFVNKLLGKIINLEEFPQLGLKKADKYYYLIDKNYLVTYQINKNNIYILTIKNIKLKEK